jgi:RNA polymerase sigma factor (TIGR02999 family)
MSPFESSDATRILADLRGGDTSAAERLLPLVYTELRAMAGGLFRGQRSDHTLQPTALVHEAYVRLVNRTAPQWEDRRHFCAVAATAMRQILADHARRKRAEKRGGGRARVTLDAAVTPPAESTMDLVALDDALTRLADVDNRKHRVVELRFFGGLTVEDVAAVLEVSKTTIESEWRAARAWLKAELSRERPE